jgi:hypothetical protein
MDSLAAGLAATSLSDPAEQSAAAAAGGGGGPDSDYLRHVMRAVEGADATIRSQVRNHLVPPPSSPDLLLACNSERVLFRSMRVLNCEFGHFIVALQACNQSLRSNGNMIYALKFLHLSLEIGSRGAPNLCWHTSPPPQFLDHDTILCRFSWKRITVSRRS